MTQIPDTDKDEKEVTSSKKKPYSKPKLYKYGNIASLTTGGSGFMAEGMSGMSGMNMGGMGGMG